MRGIVPYFCINCWNEIKKDVAICTHCGADQTSLTKETFVEKLIRALHHPEPETPIRAAFVLGNLRAQEAVPALVRLLHESPDPYIAAACAEALGRVGGTDALSALRHIFEIGRSVIVRQAAEQALKYH